MKKILHSNHEIGHDFQDERVHLKKNIFTFLLLIFIFLLIRSAKNKYHNTEHFLKNHSFSFAKIVLQVLFFLFPSFNKISFLHECSSRREDWQILQCWISICTERFQPKNFRESLWEQYRKASESVIYLKVKWHYYKISDFMCAVVACKFVDSAIIFLWLCHCLNGFWL